MQLIKQSKLFFKENNSDKVYEIDLCALTATEYLVNFRYGRRAAALKEGTKTPTALSLEAATAIFDQIEKEKLDKGYRSEIQMEIDIPVLESQNLNPVEAKILQRLEDAAKGTKSFKTQWKISRVIWKAGQLNLQAAIPYIISLANKGDYFQLHASLWTLAKMKAVAALPLFIAFATDSRHGQNINNIALLACLTLNQGTEQQKAIQILASNFPLSLKETIQKEDSKALDEYLSECTAAKDLVNFVPLYLLSKLYHFLIPALQKQMKAWPVAPPFFKALRAVYKLSQLSEDATFNGLMAYKMEAAPAVFRRTISLDAKYKYYCEPLGERIVMGAELKSADSRLGFSQFTKAYLQKNALEYLKNLGAQSDPKLYLKFAVATLLQYEEKDYEAAVEKPFRDYGRYDYLERMYFFELYDYPASPKALLLNSILFGADTSRKMNSQLAIYKGKRMVKSQRYYYQSDLVQSVSNRIEMPKTFQDNSSSEGLLDTAINTFKNWFGKKKLNPEPIPEIKQEAAPKANSVATSNSVLYPQHWNAVPEAFVQLLMQAKMRMVLEFAYNNLKNHSQFETLKAKLDNDAMIRLLQSEMDIQQNFGYELLQDRKEQISANLELLAAVLNSNSVEAVQWAQQIAVQNKYRVFEDVDFLVALLFNTKAINADWIVNQFESLNRSADKTKVILGKVVVHLLQIESSDADVENIPIVIKRLNALAASHYEAVSWDIVEQLMKSKLEANKLLAGEILKEKVKQNASKAVPISLLSHFFNSELVEVRQVGTAILQEFSSSNLSQQLNDLLPFTQTPYSDVLDVVLHQLKIAARAGNKDANLIARHLLYDLTRKEKVEGAHQKYIAMMQNDLQAYWNIALQAKDITKLVHAQYRESQMLGLEILKSYAALDSFSLGQLISFASHELLALRQFVWNYYEQNINRIKADREKALSLMDAKWADSRQFAFSYFKKHFTSNEWDADALIAIVDSVRPDVEQFGKEMITLHFKPEEVHQYLEKLCEHPSVYVQNFVSTYLSVYAKNNVELLEQLMVYFKSVLCRVNKVRVAKDRIYSFLRHEGLSNAKSAKLIIPLLDELSAQQGIQDKATCIAALTAINKIHPSSQLSLN